MSRGRSFIKLCLLCISLTALSSCSRKEQGPPLAYDMHVEKVEKSPSKATLCFHGMGGDYQIIDYVKACTSDDSTLISFNFPDHGIRLGSFNPEDTLMGTVEELLPALYLLKKTVVEEKYKEVSLYGFSAGGGAAINTLMLLNTKKHDAKLRKAGITPKDKKKILQALQKGKILLDAPLKSVSEIKDSRPPMREIEIVGARFKENGMEPIENIYHLKGLKLDVIVNFQAPDEVLTNRDDLLYIERLKEVNSKGSTVFVIEGKGHSLPHPHLWDLYKKAR
jgi:hypothetical protein